MIAPALVARNEELRENQTALIAPQDALSWLNHEARDRADAVRQANHYTSECLAHLLQERGTPLNSLLILARSLADNDEGNLDAEQVKAATIIHKSGTNLLTLINDILDLPKIEAGKM